jgi:hypothetical protein
VQGRGCRRRFGNLGRFEWSGRGEPVQRAWKESAAKPPVEIERGPGGETKNGTAEKDRRRRLLYWLLPGAVVVACLAFAFWHLRLPQPPPHISEYVRLTHDSQPKLIVGTDGNRLYLNQMEPRTISQVPVAGGQIAPISVPVNLPFLLDISPDGSTLLVGSVNDNNLWSVGVLGNSLRYLANVPTDNAVWSPDGKWVAYSTWNGEIYRARSDWSEVQKLTSATGHDKPAFFLAWAPDGETLRFTRGYQPFGRYLRTDQILANCSPTGTPPPTCAAVAGLRMAHSFFSCLATRF